MSDNEYFKKVLVSRTAEYIDNIKLYIKQHLIFAIFNAVLSLIAIAMSIYTFINLTRYSPILLIVDLTVLCYFSFKTHNIIITVYNKYKELNYIVRKSNLYLRAAEINIEKEKRL